MQHTVDMLGTSFARAFLGSTFLCSRSRSCWIVLVHNNQRLQRDVEEMNEPNKLMISLFPLPSRSAFAFASIKVFATPLPILSVSLACRSFALFRWKKCRNHEGKCAQVEMVKMDVSEGEPNVSDLYYS